MPRCSSLRCSTAASKIFFKRTQFQLHRPRSFILMREVPVGLRDCVGLEKVTVLPTRLQSARSGDVDAAIDVDPRHVDASRTKGARVIVPNRASRTSRVQMKPISARPSRRRSPLYRVFPLNQALGFGIVTDLT